METENNGKNKPIVQQEDIKPISLIDRIIGRIPNRVFVMICLIPVTVTLFPHLFSEDLDKQHAKRLIWLSVLLSYAAFTVTKSIIPFAGEKLVSKLNGVDLGKLPRQPPIPQSLGIVSGTSFLITIILTETLMPFVSTKFGVSNRQKYDTIMVSICFSVLLGLTDDVMDIRWAHKLVMGLLYSLPLMTSYSGPTSILLPTLFRPIVLSTPVQAILSLLQCSTSPDGIVLELGVFYLVYIVALIVFCTNAINIYAGINGLEVGQSFIIACGVAIIDSWELYFSTSETPNFNNHLFSLTIMLPFIGTSLGLLSFNWYPARAFIGDVFPYYAGMTFAATAVLGHYSRSLLLLLVPQVLNYIYSMPQLFGLVPCPRHRLPAVNPITKLLEPSKVGPNDTRANMTLICLALRIFGPMRERTLTVVLLLFQIICTVAFGLLGRYVLSRVLFGLPAMATI
jgi:UDP-N-acetylglucosamine--dolichyl-phosphate N-acetylglucosaminephosphotransferase